MSPRNIPIDEFQQLDRQAIACALRLIELEVAGTLDLLATDEAARLDQVLLDELTSVLTLRKVFRARLAELLIEEDATAVGRLGVGHALPLASERYRQPLLQPSAA
ncbi:MAG: hypothetical protein ACRYFZ_19600 [Janthinobacterium lividum]